MIDIVIPKPVPPGQKVDQGRRYSFPACDRCEREGSDRNPVLLGGERPSEDFREALRGVTRRNALCVECRDYLKGLR